MATTATPDMRLSPLPPATGRAGLRGAIASEFTKIRSVRSTYWTLIALVVVTIGIGTLACVGAVKVMTSWVSILFVPHCGAMATVLMGKLRKLAGRPSFPESD